VPAPDDELWDQVSDLLARRPGWTLEQSTTPGGLPSWCSGGGGEVELSVTVSGGSARVYVTRSDRELAVGNADGLRLWLDDNEARFG
jgi:hypothetical protein